MLKKYSIRILIAIFNKSDYHVCDSYGSFTFFCGDSSHKYMKSDNIKFEQTGTQYKVYFYPDPFVGEINRKYFSFAMGIFPHNVDIWNKYFTIDQLTQVEPILFHNPILLATFEFPGIDYEILKETNASLEDAILYQDEDDF